MYYIIPEPCPQCGHESDKCVVILYARKDTGGVPDIGQATRVCIRCWLGLDMLMAKLTGFAETKEHLEKGDIILAS